MADFKTKPVGKLILVFAGMAFLALPFIVFKAVSVPPAEAIADIVQPPVSQFDHNARQLFETYTATTPVYMQGTATARTLDYYYSLRQYPGSPPVIPHGMADPDGIDYVCLSCHERGGFTAEMNRFTPVTPHPQHSYCRQCHMEKREGDVFTGIDWRSVQRPKLGRSALGGSPPIIPHTLQMRENCVACHVGPGAVVSIRVEHPMRGYCRQCHVHENTGSLFSRSTPE